MKTLTSKEIQEELSKLYLENNLLRMFMHDGVRGVTRKRIGKLQRDYSKNLKEINRYKRMKLEIRMNIN